MYKRTYINTDSTLAFITSEECTHLQELRNSAGEGKRSHADKVGRHASRYYGGNHVHNRLCNLKRALLYAYVCICVVNYVKAQSNDHCKNFVLLTLQKRGLVNVHTAIMRRSSST